MPLGKLALSLAIDSLRVGRPFAVLALHGTEDGTRTLRWFSEATDDKSVLRARHETATSDCHAYAIVVHEDVRDREGTMRRAVVVEVGDRTHDNALRMAQHYDPFGGPDQPLEARGNPMMLGDTVNVLRGSALDPGRPAAFVVVCPKCSKKNRVSLARVRDRLPKCGSCGASLLHE